LAVPEFKIDRTKRQTLSFRLHGCLLGPGTAEENNSGVMDINDLDGYKRSMRLAEEIWTEVEHWPPFATYSIGEQITKATDSIAANTSEGLGRYHYGKNRHFCYYARGSLQETRTWLQNARSQDLISEECFDEGSTELIEIRKMLNSYLHPIGRQKNS
jgi:four helix bundle protein